MNLKCILQRNQKVIEKKVLDFQIASTFPTNNWLVVIKDKIQDDEECLEYDKYYFRKIDHISIGIIETTFTTFNITLGFYHDSYSFIPVIMSQSNSQFNSDLVLVLSKEEGMVDGWDLFGEIEIINIAEAKLIYDITNRSFNIDDAFEWSINKKYSDDSPRQFIKVRKIKNIVINKDKPTNIPSIQKSIEKYNAYSFITEKEWSQLYTDING